MCVCVPVRIYCACRLANLSVRAFCMLSAGDAYVLVRWLLSDDSDFLAGLTFPCSPHQPHTTPLSSADAFLTAAVLAAVAEGTSQLTGIANQVRFACMHARASMCVWAGGLVGVHAGAAFSKSVRKH